MPFSLSSGKGKKQQRNPENPACPLAPGDGTGVRKEKPLSKKTIEDVLLHFAKTHKVARRRYREFVKNGIEQGKRPEFQGGAVWFEVLVETNRASWAGRKKSERRETQGFLGSGVFVNTTLHQSEKLLERKYRPKKAMDDLMTVVADKVGMAPELICS